MASMTDSDRILRFRLLKSRFFDLESSFSIHSTPHLFHYSTVQFAPQRSINRLLAGEIRTDKPQSHRVTDSLILLDYL